MKKKIICIICPTGCEIKVSGDNGVIDEITGNDCNRGTEYASDEFLCPKRILTTTVKTQDPLNPVISVRSRSPLPKEKMFDCMDILKKVKTKPQIKCGDIIVSNILDTGVDIIITGMTV